MPRRPVDRNLRLYIVLIGAANGPAFLVPVSGQYDPHFHGPERALIVRMLFHFFVALLLAGDVYAIPGAHRIRRQDGPIPSGTISDCTYFVDAASGDTCASIAAAWGITTAQFTMYNPSVKSNCSGLVIGDSYCVEENYGKGPASTSTSASMSTTGPISKTTLGPTPEQSGIASNCKDMNCLSTAVH